jgi:hypothetical protein
MIRFNRHTNIQNVIYEKKLFFLLVLLLLSGFVQAQIVGDSLNGKNNPPLADDPSLFFTRVEVFSELQHYNNNVYLNQTTIRAIVKLGKRFTTRLDIPLIYNSFVSESGYRQFGYGDISFRLLGYKFIQTPKSAVTGSIELSLNTAQSPLLGTGKNLIIPVVSYTTVLKEKRALLAVVLMQANSFSGDEERKKISFSKLQVIMMNIWSKRIWTVVAPELYLDYVNGGTSMNMEGRVAFAPVPRINFWAQTGVGVFGDFVGRYNWGTEIGSRYFFMRNAILNKKR